MAVFFAGGTQVKIGDGGSPEAFVAIGQVFGGPTGPSPNFDLLDATHHGSPNREREWIPGLVDNGNCAFSIFYDPSDPTHDAATGLIAQAVARGVANFEVVYPGVTAGSSATTFAAYVTKMEAGAPHDGLLTYNCELKITGAVSYEQTPT